MTASETEIAVVLATHNRAASLARTLASFAAMRVDGVNWQLLVVDNASTDDTRAVVEGWAGRLPVRYLYEPRLGRSNALNAGIDATRADLVVFTDDDVLVDPNWLSELWRARQTHPDAVAFGGRILSVLPKDAPRRLIERARVNDWFPDHDCGDEPGEYRPNQFPWGANVAVRGRVFEGGLRYRTEFGVMGKEGGLAGDETGLVMDIRRNGGSVWYWPAAAVHHLIQPEQLTMRFCVNRVRMRARSAVRLGAVPVGRVVCGLPVQHLRPMLRAYLTCATRWVTMSRRRWNSRLNLAEKRARWSEACRVVRDRRSQAGPPNRSLASMRTDEERSS